MGREVYDKGHARAVFCFSVSRRRNRAVTSPYSISGTGPQNAPKAQERNEGIRLFCLRLLVAKSLTVPYFLRRCETARNFWTCPFNSAISFCCSLIALSIVQRIGSLLTIRYPFAFLLTASGMTFCRAWAPKPTCSSSD